MNLPDPWSLPLEACLVDLLEGAAEEDRPNLPAAAAEAGEEEVVVVVACLKNRQQ
jgi:hypothetical protein